jgi:hypothetical protein
MSSTTFQLLLFTVFMMFVALVGWFGQWGRRNDIARYGVLTLIGILTGITGLLGGALLLIQFWCTGLYFSILGVDGPFQLDSPSSGALVENRFSWLGPRCTSPYLVPVYVWYGNDFCGGVDFGTLQP